MLSRLEELLKKHDWYFDMSDDYSKWKAGRRSMIEIIDLMRKVKRGDAVRLWKKHIPNDIFKFPI